LDAAFVVLGTLLNLAGAQLVTALKLPLFLDSFGTVIAAMWGGVIPGVAVGYLTNVFNSFFDEAALYYGLVSVVTAVLVSAFVDHGYFKERRTALPCIAAVGVVSGVLSTIIT
jgi:energy-coupling factor transport system substrate-specific component